MASVTDVLKASSPKSRRVRSKKVMAHLPSGHGKGKWHSRTVLWKAKRKARRKRLISAASRRTNRGA